MLLSLRYAAIGIAAVIATTFVNPAGAARRREAQLVESVDTRPAGEPLMAIVSLSNQRITIYDADGWILRAPVSSGQTGYETPAGIYSILQKEEEHHSNRYDDASMPFMQRITWSGIALHAGPLPGYPASHGCVRMPYEFAQGLYDLTKIGMRVIVVRTDVRPIEIDHPALFKPKLVRADLAQKALTAHWDPARKEIEAGPRAAASSEIDTPPEAAARGPLAAFKSVTAAKLAAAEAATKKADAARSTAIKLTLDAARLLPAAEAAINRAESQLRSAESVLTVATSPAIIQTAERQKKEAQARLSDAETQLAAAKSEAPLKAEAAARAREEAKTAAAEKLAALDASRTATRMQAPLSIFISRKTQRLYVRQAFQPVWESTVVIRDADRPIGTHIYTVLGYKKDDPDLRWSAVSLDRHQPDPNGRSTHNGQHSDTPLSSDKSRALAALDRIDIPQDTVDRISEVIPPQSALIISDEGMSSETGKDTDFVILISDEPRGGIKIRHRTTEAYGRYDRRYEPSYGRWPSFGPSYGTGGPFVPW